MIKLKDFFAIQNLEQIDVIQKKDRQINQPEKIKTSLKDYQKSTIYHMHLKENKKGFFINHSSFIETNFGILGEKVGAGKTFITLGLIANSKKVGVCRDVEIEVLKYYLKLKNINPNFLNDIKKYMPKLKFMKKEHSYTITDPDSVYMAGYMRSYMRDYNQLMENKTIKDLNTNLIVVPHNLIQQWRDDIDNHTDLKYYYISNIRHIRNLKIEDIQQADVVICNASKYNQLIDKLLRQDNYIYRWERVFFDEAHTVNIPKCYFTFSKFYWFITATHNEISKRPGTGFLKQTFQNFGYQLRRYLDLGRDNCFNMFVIKTNKDIVNIEYNLPPPTEIIHISNKPLWITIIEEAMTYFNNQNMNEMMYAELDRLLCTELMQNYRHIHDNFYFTNHNVVTSIISILGYKKDRYVRLTNEYNHDISSMSHRGLVPESLLDSNTRRRIERRRERIRAFTVEQQRVTNILNNIHQKLLEHNLCHKCIKKKFKLLEFRCTQNNCPITYTCNDCYNSQETQTCSTCYNMARCTFNIKEDNAFPSRSELRENLRALNVNLVDLESSGKLSKQSMYDLYQERSSSKFNNVLNLIKNSEDDQRFLFFSNFNNIFHKYEKRFKEEGIKFSLLKGNNNVIQSRLKKFKKGEFKLLLLNGKHYGSGLNLQMATDVILVHKVDKKVQTQVIGRANRMGRKGELKLHYIGFEGEFPQPTEPAPSNPSNPSN